MLHDVKFRASPCASPHIGNGVQHRQLNELCAVWFCKNCQSVSKNY